MARYRVEVEGEGGSNETLELEAPSAMAARGMVERDGHRFVRLAVVGDPDRRDRFESWIGLGAGVLITVLLLPILAVLIWLLY